MFLNVFYEHNKSLMHVWEEIKGERFHDVYEWVPYVYESNKRGLIKTIDNIPVRQKYFKTYQQYKQFCENHKAFENNVKPEIQFLAEKYHKIPDEEMPVPKLLIYSLDIELASSDGAFPNIKSANDPVNLLSVYHNKLHKSITFGLQEYHGDSKDVIYKHCQSEEELLERFFSFMHKKPCDVLTGWNVWGFDLPYLINRTKTLYGEDNSIYKKLSPIGIVNSWENNNGLNIDIAGVHILDYYDIYRWYAVTKLERYTLDFVCQHELEKGKLDYSKSAHNLRDLYMTDWDTFVDYNIIDAKRVNQLEEKLGFIKLIQALSLFTKCPMKYYQAMTQLIEGELLTYYRRNNLCAPYHGEGVQETFPAAYVKEPLAGMHSWVIDIDIASSYPSHMITLNMSNETYFGRIISFTEQEIISYNKNRKFPDFKIIDKNEKETDFSGNKLHKFNIALKRGLFAIAPCGSVFLTKPTGILATIERTVFFKRKAIKTKMKEMKREVAKMKDGPEKTKLSDRANEFFQLQWSLKILLNAMFGITSVPYSRYFNVNIAEAITSCGRHTIKQGEKFVNDLLNNPNDYKPLKEFLEKYK